MGYYRTSRELSGFIHAPDSCIDGGGWEIVDKIPVTLDVIGKGNRVVKYISRKGPHRQILITWVQTGSRIEIDHRQMIINTFFNALVRFRYDDAVKVMISTTIDPSETEEEANSRILDFINIFYPKLIKLIT
jgi:EpsI family protein